MKRPLLVRGLWALAALAALLLALRTFVGDVYHVDSGSMEPTLWGSEDGGEWVFVRYDRSAPRRHELVVLLRPGEDTPAVKRVAGLPGESLRIVGGDVRIGLKQLPPGEPRPPLVCVFDSRHQPLAEHFLLGSQDLQPWSNANDQFELDAHEVPAGAAAGLAFLHDRLSDDYPTPSGEIVRGTLQANDVAIEVEARISAPGGALRLGLNEQGDSFEVVVRPQPDGQAEVALTRRNRSDSFETLASARVGFSAGEWHRLRFSNVDDALRLELDGTRLEASYDGNVLHASDHLEEGRSYGSRAWFGGEQGRFSFRDVRVLRDLVHAARGRFGVEEPIELGPDEYFVLGDNSAKSRDSREWGAIQRSEIIGRATAVVWPPARCRRLVAVENAP